VGPTMHVALPEGAEATARVDLPSLDVSALSGARVTSYAGASVEPALAVRGACVRGPSDRWAPGAEQLVFEQATKMVARLMPSNVKRLDGGRIEKHDLFWSQRLDGRAEREGQAMHVRAVQVLGFAGSEPDIVVCAIACQEPVGGHACEAVLSSRTVGEGFVAEPPPSLLAHAVVTVAEHPIPSASVGLVMALGAVWLVLSRRPRPRRW